MSSPPTEMRSGGRRPPGEGASIPIRAGNGRRILALFRPYRATLSLLSVMILVSAALGIVPPFLLADLLNSVLRNGRHLNTTRLDLLVGGMVAIPIVTGIVGVWQTWLSNLVGQRVMHDLRTAVYAHLQRLSLAFFTRTRTGEVQSRIANDIGGVQSVVTSTATSIVSNVTTVLTTAIAMIFLSPLLSVIAFALLPIFVLVTRRIGNVRRSIASVKQGSLADMSSLVEESLSVAGVLLGKTMGRADDLTERFRDESSRLADLELRQRMAGRWMMAAVQATMAVMPAIVYGVAGHAIAGGHSISIGALVAFTTLQTRLFFPASSLLSVQADLQTSLALFDRIYEYLDLPVDIVEREHPVTLARESMRGEVAFEHVTFRYDDASAPVIEDIEVRVEAGSHVAIVGETGSGKTTMGYLVARLYDPTDGRLTIDGFDIRDLSFATLRQAVSVVSQETYLFHGSVRDNLLFARPDATDAEIELAARTAQVHGFLSSLPDGYETIVGERGYRFSGGEKQRIALARAILRDAPILVLDEATSALDVETERMLQAALDEVARERTTIAIAHRLSTIRDADVILVLDHGHIVERGTHAELVERGGRYAALVERDAVPV